MDRQLLERMVGAAVLIVALVLIVPAILDGPEQPAQREVGGIQPADAEMRTVTIRPAGQAAQPPMPAPQPSREATPAEPDDTAARMAAAAKAAAEIKPAAGPAAPPAPEPDQVAEDSGTADQAAARPVVKRQAVASPAPGWAVQLGSFARRGNATRLVQEVEDKGFSGYLEPLSSGGRSLYRVRVGPVADRDAASRLAAKLAAAGYRGQVVRETGD